MTFTDFAAWALQIAQLLLTAAIAIGIAVVVWALLQSNTQTCRGDQDYSSTGFDGQAPVALVCHVNPPQIHVPHLGGR